MNQKLLGRVFPFIPLGLGILLVIFQMNWGEADTQLPVKMMFVLIISCMLSWLFSLVGLFIYREILFAYYRRIFTILTIVYLFPAIILALFIPWTLFYALTVFLVGFTFITKNKSIS
jgi:hypothetical protein